MVDFLAAFGVPPGWSKRGKVFRRDAEDHAELYWEYGETFGDVDPYRLAKNAGGKWQYWERHWEVKKSSADRICRLCQEAGAEIVHDHGDLRGAVKILVRPVLTNAGARLGYVYEIDIEQTRTAFAGVTDYRGAVLLADRLGKMTMGWSSISSIIRSGVTPAGNVGNVGELVTTSLGEPLVVLAQAGNGTATWDDLRLEIALEVEWFDPQDPRRFETEPNLKGSDWPEIRKQLEAAGVVVIEIHIPPPPPPPALDWSQVPGGDLPVNGRRLREYQQEGVEFLVHHGLTALLGDEMGTGKTAQVVTAVNVAGYQRRLVICPKAAVPVWRREISAWSAEPHEVVVIGSATDIPDLPEAGWVITTFDVITPRVEVVKLRGYTEAEFAQIAEVVTAAGGRATLGGKTMTIRLEPDETAQLDAVKAAVTGLPGWFRDAARLRDALARVRGELLQALEAWDPEWCGVDEAHRIKNPRAGRTKVARRLLRGRPGTLISGTPLRNRAEEGMELLESLGLHHTEFALRVRRAGATEYLRVMLDHFMIRRTKAEVNSELPPKIRQIIDIQMGPKSAPYLEEYLEAMAAADELYFQELFRSGDFARAADAALGMWSKARKLLGLAKVADGAVADLIQDVVEERGCCIAFAHHRDVIAELTQQLTEADLKVGVITGDTSIADRAEVERAFQTGELDVFLGGLTAAGESITLTRADTCVNAELDWVPATMLQAEDRGHRIGQEANGYQILTCLADFGLPRDLDMDAIMWGSLARKLREINEILGEDTTLAGLPEGETARKILESLARSRAEARAQAEGRAIPTKPSKGKPKVTPQPEPSAPADDTEARIFAEYRRIDAAVAEGRLEKRLAPARKALFSRRLRRGLPVESIGAAQPEPPPTAVVQIAAPKPVPESLAQPAPDWAEVALTPAEREALDGLAQTYGAALWDRIPAGQHHQHAAVFRGLAELQAALATRRKAVQVPAVARQFPFPRGSPLGEKIRAAFE